MHIFFLSKGFLAYLRNYNRFFIIVKKKNKFVGKKLVKACERF